MIDVHSHLLPDIDDGSRSVAQSVLVLKQFAEQGVTDVILTPHVSAGELENDRDDALERRDVAYQLLLREAPEVPRLHLGFEIMMNSTLPPEILEDRRFSLAGSRYYLIEFFMSVAEASALSLLSSLTGTTAIPLVAHPERYRRCTARTVARFRELGAKVQVDATTLTRSNHRGKAVRQLLRAGLADLVAADNHGDDRTVRTAVEFLEGKGSSHVANLLAVANTQAILNDSEMTPVPGVPFRRGVWKKIRNIIRS